MIAQVANDSTSEPARRLDAATAGPFRLPDDTTDFPDHWALWRWGELDALARRLDDDRWVAVVPFLYTWAIIVGYNMTVAVYHDRWCYHSLEAAVAAAHVWDGTGEPAGWHRHPASGRRRHNGDPATETILP